MLAAHVAGRQPERREDAGGPRDEHCLQLELLGERAGVQRPGAAERDERELAWVVAALDADDAQRALHLGVDDGDHVGGIDRRRARAAAASRSSSSPPAIVAGSRPSSRFASVTVGSVPPCP